RRKQSTIRSPRLYRRPERLLYSGNIPATPTSGSESSRWPAFKWQLLQDIFPGANRGASCGVFVKIRKPHRISFESFESSSVASVSGFFGISHAVAIVVREEMSGPLSFNPNTTALGSSLCEQAAAIKAMQTRANCAVRSINITQKRHCQAANLVDPSAPLTTSRLLTLFDMVSLPTLSSPTMVGISIAYLLCACT